MKKTLLFIILSSLSSSLYAMKGTSSFSLSDEMKDKSVPESRAMARAPAEDTYYIDPDEVDMNDPIAVEKEKARIRENLEMKRQDDWYFRRNRAAR